MELEEEGMQWKEADKSLGTLQWRIAFWCDRGEGEEESREGGRCVARQCEELGVGTVCSVSLLALQALEHKDVHVEVLQPRAPAVQRERRERETNTMRGGEGP